MWSLGVVAYVLISGVLPFDGDTKELIKHKVSGERTTTYVPERNSTAGGWGFLWQTLSHVPLGTAVRTAPWTAGHSVRLTSFELHPHFGGQLTRK